MNSFVDEFKAFAMKGNVIDLAVAVVIGAAFGKIVSALVDNVIMPLIGLLLGGVDFSNLVYKVGDATVQYGMFIQAIVDFLIIALVIFMVVKALTKAQASVQKPAAAAVPETPEDIKLLREIRDNLRR
jgi:large conductance mechanosensitive channel